MAGGQDRIADNVARMLRLIAQLAHTQVLPDATADPNLAPDQVAVEMHFQTQFPALPWFGRFKSPAEILVRDPHCRSPCEILGASTWPAPLPFTPTPTVRCTAGRSPRLPMGRQAFGNLLAKRGYYLVERNDNRACRWCSEVLWVRAGRRVQTARSEHAATTLKYGGRGSHSVSQL